MASRSNAASELVRFWLEARHGCFVAEAVPVAVPYALSDIDLAAIQPADRPLALPGGAAVGPRLIVETKDEHDWEPTGREFGALLRQDAAKLAPDGRVPKGTKGVKFTMLREEHFRRAAELFGTDDFDRLFVVHALDAATLADLAAPLRTHRIHWLTLPAVVADLLAWYRAHPRPAALRHAPTGDLLHLLVGFCGLALPPAPPSPDPAPAPS